ncbi:hypothetical protein [Streptomyces lasiicapitis]|uniref:hypothetical protein n=1 Tax=Streptomyces lasiicapitis TaxID=1923961 RepID=UPI00364C81EA
MSQSDDKISDAERHLPLTPLDEALLARVQSLSEIAEAVLRNVGRPYPATDRGAVLRDALYVARLAEQLVDSAALASLADPEARRAAQDQRVKADRLRRKIQALKNANTAARNACYEALGTEAADEKRAAWAGNHLTQARAYDRLADAEAPLGTEHKRAAATQRSLAHDILDNKTTPAPTTDTQEHPA